MSIEKKNNNNLPLVIIGLVLIAAIGGGWWFYSSSKTKPKPGPVTNSNTSANRPAPPPEMGAQPPNLVGSPNASVTVEEFADFQCPTCGAMHPKFKEIQSLYGSRIKFIFRNFPLAIPAHDKAYEAAVAAEAAGLQGRFWDMQNLLFTNQQAWSANPDYRKVWEEYATRIGLDIERFKDDMAGLNAKARVEADLKRGRALNISSTPSLFINGMAIPFDQMNVEALRQIIDGELQKAPSSQQGQTTGASTNPAPANTAANTNSVKTK
ncbi:MAG TPA: thioredoxin domain-containing protein [Pyrinomonadaceae bacterium]|jgi:protein-disulfide isomerase